METGKLKQLFIENVGLKTIKYYHYLDIYETYFQRYLGRPVNILELGVYEGGSLELYRKYFGDSANIFGVDILPGCKNIENENLVSNCKIFIGDSGNIDFLNDLMARLPQIDIVIDDAGHKTSQQINAFKTIFPHINDNGVYICEDLHTNYWDEYLDTEKSFVEYIQERMQLVNTSFFKDNNKKVELQDDLWKDNVKSIYFANSIAVIEKRPSNQEFGHERTGTKSCF